MTPETGQHVFIDDEKTSLWARAMSVVKNPFTVTQTKMVKLLSDGKPHTRKELYVCLSDDLARLSSIKFHLSNIRQILQTVGHDIVCELVYRRICYRHVVLLTPTNNPFKFG